MITPYSEPLHTLSGVGRGEVTEIVGDPTYLGPAALAMDLANSLPGKRVLYFDYKNHLSHQWAQYHTPGTEVNFHVISPYAKSYGDITEEVWGVVEDVPTDMIVLDGMEGFAAIPWGGIRSLAERSNAALVVCRKANEPGDMPDQVDRRYTFSFRRTETNWGIPLGYVGCISESGSNNEAPFYLGRTGFHFPED